jgi:hypothetical protein
MRTLLFDSGPPRTPGALQAWALDVWRLVTAELWLRSSSGRPIDFFPPATVRKLTYDGRVAGGEAANHLSEPKDGTRCVTKNHSSTTTAHSSS